MILPYVAVIKYNFLIPCSTHCKVYKRKANSSRPGRDYIYYLLQRFKNKIEVFSFLFTQPTNSLFDFAEHQVVFLCFLISF